MPTDIILDEQVVTVKANRARVEGEDLEVRSPVRMPANDKAGLRRALAHGERDQLLVNVNRDYDRTEIHGPVQLRAREVPATLTVVAGEGAAEKSSAELAEGLLRLVKDVVIPLDGRRIADTDQLDGYADSVGRTLVWILRRLDAIEAHLHLQPPPRPAPPPPTERA